MSSELDVALAAAGREGIEAYYDNLDTRGDLAACARAVLASLGLTVTGVEYAYKYDSEDFRVRSNQVTGKEMVRRRTVESAWEDVP